MTVCNGIMPTRRGFKPMPTPSQAYPALPSQCLGAYFAVYPSGAARLFAATSTHLYEGISGVWTEVDGGQTFSGSSNPWQFAMFGSDCIATNGADSPQVAGSSGNFAALAGTPPKGVLIQSASDFVLMFSGYTWYCSKAGDDAVWSFSISDLSATGPLIDTPGEIVAAAKLGRMVAAYKNRGIYLGQFAGPPNVWDWYLVSPETGTFSQGCVVNVGQFHVFIGLDDFYIFDGSSASRIKQGGGPNAIKEWFFATLDQNNASKILGRYDLVNDTVYWHFPSINASPAGTLDSWIAWNIRTGKWTMGNDTIEAVVLPFTSASTPWTYAQFQTAYVTYGGIVDVPYGSQLFAGSNIPIQAYFKTDHSLYLLNGSSENAGFTTGDLGLEPKTSFVDNVRPAYATFPTSATVTGYYRDTLGEALTEGDTADLQTDGFMPLRQSARYHRLAFAMVGDWEMISFDADIALDGDF